MYYPTHARCGPWLVGMTLGFIMYQLRNEQLRVNKKLLRILWIFSISALFTVVLGYFPFQQSENFLDIPNAINATYNAFYRSCWAIAIAFIIFACHNGSGGVIRWFLCLQIFQPLAKMSLSMYLSHRIYQIISIASIRQPIYLSASNLIHVFFGDVVLSLIVGAAVYLTIEAPFTTLENRLFRRSPTRKW